MANIKIRDLDDGIIEALDDIVKKEKYSSRNQLLLDILKLYVSSRNDFFLSALPETVKFLAIEANQKEQDTIEKSLKLTYDINLKLYKKIDKLSAIFGIE